MSATLIRSTLNWRNLMVVYVLSFSFIWGLAVGASGGNWRPMAFVGAVERAATLGLDLAGIQVMSAAAYARGPVGKGEPVTSAAAAVETLALTFGSEPEYKPFVATPLLAPIRVAVDRLALD